MGLLAAVFLVDDMYEEKAREKIDGSKWTTNVFHKRKNRCVFCNCTIFF